jgi:serine/threonine-protein kinase
MTTSSSVEAPAEVGPKPSTVPEPSRDDAFATQAAGTGMQPVPSHHSLPATEALPAYPLGRYRLEKLLGRGGMGSVYLARDLDLDRPVALKIPNFSDPAPAEAVERFFREAHSAAAITHPNICPVYAAGDSGGVRYMAMGYIEGRPLSDYIKPDRPQAERQAAAVVRKLAFAIQEAHDHGIIHRDLKPGNIMIDRRSEPILMDFGLARNLQDASQARLTQEGLAVGTPAYMSPEQVQGRADLGPATDIYSLGVILYELLTATQPFRGNIAGILGQILHVEAKPVRELKPEVSPDIAAICAKAMAKDPAQRYASMKDFGHALSNFLKGKPGNENGTMELPPGSSAAGAPSDSKDASQQTRGGADDTEWESLLANRKDELPEAPRRRVTTRPSVRTDDRRPQPLMLMGIGIAIGVGAVLLLPRLFQGKPSTSPPVSVASTGAEEASPAPSAPTASTSVEEHPAVVQSSPEVAPASSPKGEVVVIEEPGKREGSPTEPADAPSEPVAKAPPADLPTGDSTATGTAAAPPEKSVASVGGDKKEPPAAPTKTDTGKGEPMPKAPASAQPKPPPPRPDPPMQGGGPPGPPDVKQEFAKFDQNGDDVLTEDELPEHVFKKVDTNKDGKGTLKELEAAYKKYRDRLHAPPGQNNNRPPPRRRP